MNTLRFAAVLLPLFSSLAYAGPNLDEAAKGLCKCLVEPYKLMNRTSTQFKQAQASGDMSKLTAIQGEMMEVMNASQPCFDALSKKYPKIDQSDPLKKQVMEIAEKQCPSPVPPVSR